MDDGCFTISREPPADGTGARSHTRVTLDGEFDLGARDGLRKLLLDVIHNGEQNRLVIDMHRVSFIDCAAVSAILDAFGAASQIGIPMHLINAHGIVLRVFELIGVPELFDLASNDRDAEPDR